MTKEEAKLILDNARPQTKEIDRQFYDDEDLNNALNMAIKALEQQSDDCVSRAAVFETIDDCNSDGLKGIFCSYDDGERFKEYIKKLPPVTPTHGTCKDCGRLATDKDGDKYCELSGRYNLLNFYCADFEKRGDSDDSN